MTSQASRTNVANLFNSGMAALSIFEEVPALGALLEKSTGYDADKNNHLARIGTGKVKIKNGRMSDVGTFKFEADGSVSHDLRGQQHNYRLNDNAWGQLCYRMGSGLFDKGSLHKPTFMAGIQSTKPSIRAQMAELLNAIMAEANPNVLLLRSYQSTLRAVLTTSYAPIDNSRMLTQLGESLAFQKRQYGLDAGQIGVTRQSAVSPDSMYVTVVTKGLDPKDSLLPSDKLWEGRGGTPGGLPYGLGVRISNDETGNGRMKVSPVIKRTSCDNSIVIGHEDTLSITHLGSTGAISYSLTAAMANALRIGFESLNQLLAVREVEIENPYTAIEHLAEEYGWSTEQAELIHKGAEGQRNLYGLVNGLSYVPAHSDLSAEAQAQFEELAGGLLHNPGKYLPKREFAWVERVQPATAK
jgi:hypothetical protein